MILPRPIYRTTSAAAELSGFCHAERLPLEARPQLRRPTSNASMDGPKLIITRLPMELGMETVEEEHPVPLALDMDIIPILASGVSKSNPSFGSATPSTSTPAHLGEVHPFFNLPLTTGNYVPSVRSTSNDFPMSVLPTLENVECKTDVFTDISLSTPASTSSADIPNGIANKAPETSQSEAPYSTYYTPSKLLHAYDPIYDRPPASDVSFLSFSDLAIAEGLVPSVHVSLTPVKKTKKLSSRPLPPSRSLFKCSTNPPNNKSSLPIMPIHSVRLSSDDENNDSPITHIARSKSSKRTPVTATPSTPPATIVTPPANLRVAKKTSRPYPTLTSSSRLMQKVKSAFVGLSYRCP